MLAVLSCLSNCYAKLAGTSTLLSRIDTVEQRNWLSSRLEILANDAISARIIMAACHKIVAQNVAGAFIL